MATPVEMPKLGNTVEDCLISAWLKHEGDSVAAGDVIAEIETDKTSFEITAPVGGVMLATFFPEGALVPVFTAICAIGQPGESVQGPAGGRPDSASLAGEGLEGPGGDGQPRGTTPELPRLSPLSSTAVDGALQEAP
ncbi:MAG TPA: lipoyl domain-containing protein, partial [Acidimicrobiales bacterium]|nr:lipoyl domain-containing protein [Acidimicrobiales bacterium]